MAYKCKKCGGWIEELCDMNSFDPPCSCKKVNWKSEAEKITSICGLYKRDVDRLEHDLQYMTALAERYKQERNETIQELLTNYSQYLEDCGYMDNDWWCEEPNSVDRFLQEKDNE